MLRRLAAAALLLAAAGALHAQPFPNRPIKLVVGFAPAGAADFVARTLGEPLSRGLGQPIVIDNRPGAGSSIAAEYVAKSAPDGYTVLIASPSSILVNPLLFAVLGYLPENTKEVWVFTGQNSKHNIALYNRAGYEHQFDQVAGDLTYAYLRKVLEAGAIVDDDDDVAVRGDN